MNASYRLQLTPEFGFAEVQACLGYLKQLGVSHLYLSPITEARTGSAHGYDVTDHNRVREELGGAAGFEALREAVVAAGLELILDFVPNHAGVGSSNLPWQDVLAYGPHSPFAAHFDIDWQPLKRELTGKVLLPFLGRPYGEVIDAGEVTLHYTDGDFYASYYDNRFALTPACYATLLAAALPLFERTDAYFDLKDLHDAYADLGGDERDKALGLKVRLTAIAGGLEFTDALASFAGDALHALLERQFWRLAFWRTAGDDINYRRFFDINELVGLRMETPGIFWEAHHLLGELVVKEGVAGVRIDHVDGLFDPHAYLQELVALGAKHIWVEKILAPGETLPEAWPVSGTTGYEFLNDAQGVLVNPAGEHPLTTGYRRFLNDFIPYHDEAWQSKRTVMETSLAGELARLVNDLNRLSEADYHTRDFTQSALREALVGLVAAFPRYRSYLPYDPEVAREVVQRATGHAKQHSVAADTSVYDFIEACLLGDLRGDLQGAQASFIGRFQQYTAPVTAKGLEDTAFYRYVPLAALNEVGGEPERFGVTLQAFHARARYRAHRYPDTLLTSATHDHKRGEDTRARLVVLADLPELWQETLSALSERAQHYYALQTDPTPLGLRVAPADEHFFYQHLVALWVGETPASLAERLVAYLHKAVREAKLRSSWVNPNTPYEDVLAAFVRHMTQSDEVAAIIAPLAEQVARHGFANGLAQLTLKLTTPGVPDLYQGCELLDLSLVDPDNRRPVDYAHRQSLLDALEQTPPDVTGWVAHQDERAKLMLTTRLLRLRRDHPALFVGAYRTLEPTGDRADHLIAFARTSDHAQLVVLVSRFPAALGQAGGWSDTHLTLPEEFAGHRWTEVLTGETLQDATQLRPPALPVGVYLRLLS